MANTAALFSCKLVAQVQAMHKLNQPAVIVKAREVDVNIMQGVLEAARSKFKQTYGTDAPTVAMADNYLPGPPSGRYIRLWLARGCLQGSAVRSVSGKSAAERAQAGGFDAMSAAGSNGTLLP